MSIRGRTTTPHRPLLAGRQLRRGLALAAALTGAAATLAGCGGSSSVTKHDAVAQANAICSTSVSQVRALKQPAGDPAYYNQVAKIVTAEAKKLKVIPRPAHDRAVLDLFVSSINDAAGLYRQLASAARTGDQAAVSQLTAKLAANPASTYATSYGVRECAGTSGTLVSR